MTATEHTERIIDFLREISLHVAIGRLDGETFLPGIRISQGALAVDPERLEWPGDLLHEAGHIAVLSPNARKHATDDAFQDQGGEIAAIAWSWAAARHLDLPAEVLFHAGGYLGEAAWLADTFNAGHFPGLPLLQWMELAARDDQVAAGAEPYPVMQRWLRVQ